MTIFRIFLIILITGFGSLANGDLYDDYNNSVSKKPFVSFLAREGIPGHTFVGLGVELDNGLLFYEGLYGFYPDGNGKITSLKSLFSVDGKVEMRWADLHHDHELRVELDENDHLIVQQILETWKSDEPKYSLLTNNCNNLALEIAQSIGSVNIPSNDPGATLPAIYIEAFVNAND